MPSYIPCLSVSTLVLDGVSLHPHTLTINKEGLGSGTIISSPSAISCGSVCTATFSPGTAVTLTALADSGSTFFGWSGGGCSGTGACTVIMNSAKTITALLLKSAGGVIKLENILFTSGDTYEIVATTSITVGPGVEIESGATLVLEAPTINIIPDVHAEEGARFEMRRQ